MVEKRSMKQVALGEGVKVTVWELEACGGGGYIQDDVSNVSPTLK